MTRAIALTTTSWARRRANYFDNALNESFFGTLKAEYYHLATPDGISALEAGVHYYIRYYNHERI